MTEARMPVAVRSINWFGLVPEKGQTMSNGSLKRTLQYVKNTGGGATKAIFIEDHEPIGERLWQTYFEEKGYITIDSAGRIYLTEAGSEALKSA